MLFGVIFETLIFRIEFKCARARIMAWNLPVTKGGCFTYRYEIYPVRVLFSYRQIMA